MCSPLIDSRNISTIVSCTTNAWGCWYDCFQFQRMKINCFTSATLQDICGGPFFHHDSKNKILHTRIAKKTDSTLWIREFPIASQTLQNDVLQFLATRFKKRNFPHTWCTDAANSLQHRWRIFLAVLRATWHKNGATQPALCTLEIVHATHCKWRLEYGHFSWATSPNILLRCTWVTAARTWFVTYSWATDYIWLHTRGMSPCWATEPVHAWSVQLPSIHVGDTQFAALCEMCAMPQAITSTQFIHYQSRPECVCQGLKSPCHPCQHVHDVDCGKCVGMTNGQHKYQNKPRRGTTIDACGRAHVCDRAHTTCTQGRSWCSNSDVHSSSRKGPWFALQQFCTIKYWTRRGICCPFPLVQRQLHMPQENQSKDKTKIRSTTPSQTSKAECPTRKSNNSKGLQPSRANKKFLKRENVKWIKASPTRRQQILVNLGAPSPHISKQMIQFDEGTVKANIPWPTVWGHEPKAGDHNQEWDDGRCMKWFGTLQCSSSVRRCIRGCTRLQMHTWG